MKEHMPVLLSTLCILSSVTAALPLKNNLVPDTAGTLSIFIDCDVIDLDFMKTEIGFVNHVTDRNMADVHILITTQETAGGGTEYTITFFGQRIFQGMTDTMTCVSGIEDSEDTARRGLAQKLKIGLMRYIAQTRTADDIVITAPASCNRPEPEDRWHNWVFSANINGYFNGEKSYKYNYVSGALTANRTTENWKLQNEVYYNYTKTYYVIDETTTVPSLSKSYGVDGLAVRSLDDHWSAGLSADVYSSTYSNIDVSCSIQPALEYDIFPYGQATSREIRILYNPGLRYCQYIDTTIYGKMSEVLPFEYVSITLDTKQRWGSITTTVSGKHFIPDYRKNRVSLDITLSFPLTMGFSLKLWGWASVIHDQVSLSKRGLTPEEILLRIKQQATQYQYYSSIGLSYSFGSRYSSIVNPRFGD